MGRTTWNIYTMPATEWVANGTIYRPNDQMQVGLVSTQEQVPLADGSLAYVTPETKYRKERIRFIWFEEDGTVKTKIEGYITAHTYVKIVDHDSNEYIGRFLSIIPTTPVGRTDDVYDLEAMFERMA